MLDYINYIYYFNNGKYTKLTKYESKILDKLLMNKGQVVINKKLSPDKIKLKKAIQNIKSKTKIKIHSINNIGYVIL